MTMTTRQFGDTFANLMFRNWRLIAVVWGVCVLVALAAALLLPKTYEAKATVLVKFGREYIYLPETGSERAAAPQRAGLQEAINTEVQILASRDLSERVIADVGLTRLYPDLGEDPESLALAMGRFRGALDIRPVERSNIINIYFRHSDPVLAADALNALVRLFPLKRLDVYRDSDVPFFTARARDLETELAAAEDEFAQLRSENGLFDVDAQKDDLLDRKSRVVREIADGEKRLAELNSRRAAIERDLRDEPRVVTMYTESERGRLLDDARERLFALRLKEAELLNGYREESRAVTTVRREIANIEDFIARSAEDVTGRTTRVGPNEIYDALRQDKLRLNAEAEALEQRVAVARSQLDDLEQEIVHITRFEARHDAKERQVAALRRSLSASLNDVADAQKLAAMDQQNRTNIRIVQKAVPPTDSVGLSRKARVLLSIPLGLIAGILAVMAQQMFRAEVSEPATAARRTGLDVLATLDRKD